MRKNVSTHLKMFFQTSIILWGIYMWNRLFDSSVIHTLCHFFTLNYFIDYTEQTIVREQII